MILRTLALFAMETEVGKHLPLIVGVLVGALSYFLAHLLGDLLHEWLPWLQRTLKRIHKWLLLWPIKAVFPFEVLDSVDAMRMWLTTKQRLTLIGDYASRAILNRKGSYDARTRLVLIQAPADIGKTREALYQIERFVEEKGIANDVSILVPRHILSLPDFLSLSTAHLGSVLRSNVILFLDDLPLLRTDPRRQDKPREVVARLLDQFRLRPLSSLMIIATGRTDDLVRTLGADFLESEPFSAFELLEVPSFSPRELDTVIIQVGWQKGLELAAVAQDIARAAGNASAENIVQFVDNCKTYAALSQRMPWRRRIFGGPTLIRDQPMTEISPELVGFLSTKSSTTWKNLVYEPAIRNYPEVAAIYRGVATLVSAGALSYVELVIDVARRSLGVGIWRSYRIEKALRFLIHNRLDCRLGEDGVVYCPDVATDGTGGDATAKEIRALAKCLPRFAALATERATISGASLFRMSLAAGCLLATLYVAGTVLVAWISAGQIQPRGPTDAVAHLLTFLVLSSIVLIGYQARSDESSVYVYTCVALVVGLSLAAYMLNSVFPVPLQMIAAIMALSLVASGLLTPIMFETYRRLDVWRMTRRLRTVEQIRDVLGSLQLVSLGRAAFWVKPLMVSQERGWLGAMAAYGVFIVVLFVRNVSPSPMSPVQETYIKNALAVGAAIAACAVAVRSRASESAITAYAAFIAIGFLSLLSMSLVQQTYINEALVGGAAGAAYLAIIRSRPWRSLVAITIYGVFLLVLNSISLTSMMTVQQIKGDLSLVTVIVALLCAFKARPYRVRGESVLVMTLFGLAFAVVPGADAWGVVGLFGPLWALFMCAIGTYVTFAARGEGGESPAALLSRRPVSRFGVGTGLVFMSRRFIWLSVCAIFVYIGVGWYVNLSHPLVNFDARIAAITGLGDLGPVQREFAQSVLLEVASVLPPNSRIEERIAREYLRVADYAEAARHIERFAALLPRGERRNEALAGLEVAALNSGQDELAATTIDLLERSDPPSEHTAGVVAMRAELLLNQGRFKESLDTAVRAAHQHPESAAWDVITADLIQLGSCDQLEGLVGAAALEKPETVMARGRCLLQRGHTPDVENQIVTLVNRPGVDQEIRSRAIFYLRATGPSTDSTRVQSVPRGGAILLVVESSGQGRRLGMQEGDIIIEADGNPIRTVAGLNRARAQAHGPKMNWVLWRHGQTIKMSGDSSKALGVAVADF